MKQNVEGVRRQSGENWLFPMSGVEAFAVGALMAITWITARAWPSGKIVPDAGVAKRSREE